LILVGLFKGNKVKFLKEHGVPIQATIKGVDLITSYTVNDEHPYQIISHWKQTNSSDIHVFYSENIWFDPSEYIEEIDEVTVLIEKDNPSKYYVDVSFLPKLAS